MIRSTPQENSSSLVIANTGFAAKAVKALQTDTIVPDRLENTRADFLQALELLGAGCKLRRSLLNEKTRLTARVHISCKQRTWCEIFGEPQCVEQYHFQSSRTPVHIWKHFCKDGAVACVGHIFERSPGDDWIVVVRVGLLYGPLH